VKEIAAREFLMNSRSLEVIRPPHAPQFGALKACFPIAVPPRGKIGLYSDLLPQFIIPSHRRISSAAR
jgi:hypothetical protein